MTGKAKNTRNTSPPSEPECRPLEAMFHRFRQASQPRAQGNSLRLLGISGFAALPLYLYGLLGLSQAAGLILLGWLVISRAGLFPVRVQGTPRGILPRVLLHGLDMILIMAVGLGCHVLEGETVSAVLIAAAAGLSSYLAYYSAVSLLKSVPSRVRLGHPERMVELDHLFLSHAFFWGGEREIVIGITALGLLAGMPVAGLLMAAAAGNINWMVKSALFWREVRDDKA